MQRKANLVAHCSLVESADQEWLMCDFRLPPACIWELRSCGILRIAEWLFSTDVSAQHIGPISKDQAVQELLTLEDGTDRLSRNIGKKLQF
jgi:hypothetical protein